MKILVAYYSFEGHTKKVAEKIAEAMKNVGETHIFRIEEENTALNLDWINDINTI